MRALLAATLLASSTLEGCAPPQRINAEEFLVDNSEDKDAINWLEACITARGAFLNSGVFSSPEGAFDSIIGRDCPPEPDQPIHINGWVVTDGSRMAHLRGEREKPNK